MYIIYIFTRLITLAQITQFICMKKIFLITTCLFIFLGCSKNNNTNFTVVPKQTKSKDLNKSTDSLLINDSVKNAKKIAINSDVSCAYSKSYSSPYPSSYYTVISRFPVAGASSVIIPKGSWQAGIYAFNNQDDGNLVVYVKNTGKVLWASGTNNKVTRLDAQNDLNLVLYQVNGPPVFESQTYYYKCGSKNPRNTMLVLTNDGDLSIIADGMATFGPVTVTLATTRTFGGVVSPNNGTFFKLYTTSGGTGGVNFVY